MICGRCGKKDVTLEYEGKENGKIIWRIYHCKSCSFTWRDTEPDYIIEFDKRDPDFRIYPDNLEKYPIILK
jgi:hypothetical protein